MKINVRTRRKTAKSRRIKTKLIARKGRERKMHAACKNTVASKDTAVNLVDDTCTNDVQNISLAGEPASSFRERTAAQANLKRKKEPFDNEKTAVDKTSDIQYFTIDSIERNDLKQQASGKIDNNSKLDNSEDETQGDTGDSWTLIASKEKRNLGLPLVVDMHSDSVISINLPQIFEHEQRTKLEGIICNDASKLNALFNKNARMTVADPINSKYNTHVQIKHLEQASSVPLSTAENDGTKETSDNRLEDMNVNHTSSPMRRPYVLTHREFVEDGISTADLSSSTEAHGSSRHENVSLHQRTCNQKTPKIHCIRNIVIVIMKSGSKLSFTGKLLVKVLYGAVKIYGSILNRSTGTTEVYSPRGYSNIVIETSEEFPEGSVDDVWTTLAAEGITRDSKTELQVNVDKIRPGTAVLVLQNFENNLTLFLKTHFPYFRLFPEIKNPHYFYSWTDPRLAEIILQSILSLKQNGNFKYRRLISDPSITDVAEKMLSRWRANDWSCTLIAGGKNVGKSTSVRYLINTLLRTSEKVVLVDVDPGQTECTPPGCISYSLIEEPLMGPNFTHLKAPVHQLFIDDVNVSRCVTRYIEGIKILIERLKECPVLSRLPIVVNTMGFTQNLGWDIAIFTIKLIRPSIILQIMSSKKKNNYNDVLSAEVVNKQECSWTFCDERFIDWNRPCEHDLCTIYSRAENSRAETVRERTNRWNMEPYQQRELVMMSYLSGIVHNKNDSLQYNTGHIQYNTLSLSINEAVPYTAPFSSLCIIPQRLFGVPASRALSVINGNIVALCGIDLTEESSQESEGISSLRVLTQRSPLCTCYGFGIIRGVDMERQEVFINTPLPLSMMQHINCLAGCIPVPPGLLQLHQGAPYVGGNAALPTSREPRRGYFRMRYQKPSKSQ